MKEHIIALRTTILGLAARPEGALTAELRALGYTERQLTNTLFSLMQEGSLWSFRKGTSANYFETESRMLQAKQTWAAGANERLRRHMREKYATKVQNPEWVAYQAQKKAENRGRQRDAAIAAGTLVPRTPRPPKPAAAPKQPKPYTAAPVTIKPTGRGPAYLPGDPVRTERTIYTYGRSPSNPTRTNTHSEAA